VKRASANARCKAAMATTRSEGFELVNFENLKTSAASNEEKDGERGDCSYG
jgi:hypothetical protein